MIPELPLPRLDGALRRREPSPDPLAPTAGSGSTAPASPALEPAPAPAPAEPMQIPTDRMIGLRFIKAALGRTRRFWLATAAAGLAIGALYHVAVPLKYWATSTVYLAHASTAASTVAAQDDLAMLQTNSVARRALAHLHDPALSPGALLGKQPGTLLSQNVLEIAVSGPSPQAAVRRVNALTSAYLSFRAQEYDQQSRALVAATTAQVAKLQSEVATLSAKIAASPATSGQLTVLQAQRTAALSQITGLDAAIQQDQLNHLAVTNGSKVLSAGALAPSSEKKAIVLDGLTGLVAGLGLGVTVILALAMLTDRVRRREDVAALLGVPVTLSVAGLAGRGPGALRRAVRPGALRRRPELHKVVHHLRQQLRSDGAPSSVLVVPVGSAREAATALVALSFELSGQGADVVLVDSTPRRVLRRTAGRAAARRFPGPRRRLPALTVVTAPLPPGVGRTGPPAPPIASGATVLVLATVDPAVGASHLRSWNRRAVVMVSAGHARVQQLASTVELLDAAGVAVGSAVLIGAEPGDDSVGLPARSAPVGRPAASAALEPRSVGT